MNIVFMGTPEFSVPALKAIEEKYGIKAVFTQPDRPRGRGKKLAPSPVKEFAESKGIKIYQPEVLKNSPEVIEELKAMEPDFIIVVAFGQILTKEVLDIPKYGCINLHASLLPKYRGAAPINWCIIHGEKYSGNTTMLMDVGIDTGDMLLKSKYEITPSMTYGELHDVLMEDGGKLLIDTMEALVNGTVVPEKQNHSESCKAPLLNKNLANIDWNKSAKDLVNLVRGLYPRLITYTNYKEDKMKIIKASLLDETEKKEPGKILEVSKKGIKVACGEGTLLIEQVQFPNGKPLRVEEYIKGNTIEENVILTSDISS
jgi:methionyl-tRNA formyltransferase